MTSDMTRGWQIMDVVFNPNVIAKKIKGDVKFA